MITAKAKPMLPKYLMREMTNITNETAMANVSYDHLTTSTILIFIITHILQTCDNI